MDLNYLGFNFLLISPQLDPLWAILRLLIALVFGGLVGWERGRHFQIAGLRTHILITVASCLIMEVGLILSGPDARSGDPARMAAQIVSGIGFLGAGAILRFGISVHGVTTAASIWASSAIGLAVGAGMYLLAGATTLVLLFVLRILEPVSHRLSPRQFPHRLKLSGKRLHERLPELKTVIEKFELRMEDIGIDYDKALNTSSVGCDIVLPDDFDIPALVAALEKVKDVEGIHIEAIE